MKPLFWWYGNKRRVARKVWDYLGNPRLYIEPFGGSLAVLLGRPSVPQGAREIVNDRDHMIVNFWRAVRADHEAVADAAMWPPYEADLTARHRWLLTEGAAILQANIPSDPFWYDAQIAGWWWWGLTMWLGRGWMVSGHRATLRSNRPLPHNKQRDEIVAALHAAADRLRNVSVYAGSWETCVSKTIMRCAAPEDTAVFLDPPYQSEGIDTRQLYSVGTTTDDVVEWCKAHGESVRIVLCGYRDDYDLNGWSVVPWSGSRGFRKDMANRHREALYVSPACAQGAFPLLFDTP